jgi:hypothetical protein
MKHKPYQRGRKKGDTAKLAARLAPLEEQDTRAAQKQGRHVRDSNNGLSQENGAIIVDTNNLNLPKGINDERDEGGKKFFGIEPLVLFILSGMLAFIVFIAWQISQMPPPE